MNFSLKQSLGPLPQVTHKLASVKARASPNNRILSHRFSELHGNRLYQDHSLSKASRRRQQHSDLGNKLINLQRRLACVSKRRHSLHEQTESAQAFSNKLRVIALLDRQYTSKLAKAATKIQKHVRGFITRKLSQTLLLTTHKTLLQKKIGELESKVDHCWIHMNEITLKAAVYIQKHTRVFLQKCRTLAKAQLERKRNEAATHIQAFARGCSARRNFHKLKLQARDKKLKEIRERLRWLWLKKYWQRKRLNWHVIRQRNKKVLVKIESVPFDNVRNAFRRKSIGDLPGPVALSSSRRASEDFTIVSRPSETPATHKIHRISAHFMRPTQNFLSKLEPTWEEPLSKPQSTHIISNRRFQRNTQSRELYIKARQERPRTQSIVFPKKQRKDSELPSTDFSFPPLIHFNPPRSHSNSSEDADWIDPPVYFDAYASSTVFKDALPHLYSFVERYGMNVK